MEIVSGPLPYYEFLWSFTPFCDLLVKSQDPSRTEAYTDFLAVCERYSLLANDKKQMIAGELDRSVREIERKISVSVLRYTISFQYVLC